MAQHIPFVSPLNFRACNKDTLHTDENMPAQTIIISWVVPECKAIAEHGVVFDADLLFLVDYFQSVSACRVHSVVNDADLKL